MDVKKSEDLMSKLYGVLLSSDATVVEMMAAMLTIIIKITKEGCEDDQMKRARMGTVIETLKSGLGLE